MKVIMRGVAGEDPKHRWEGDIISPKFKVPGKEGLYVVVQWNWAGRENPTTWEQINHQDWILNADGTPI